MVHLLKRYIVIFCIIGLFCIFFSPILQGLLPIPSDALVGSYHPYRDLFFNEFKRGVPIKNTLITDPVRQLYQWKKLTIDSFLTSSLPLWNPYEMSGKPLLANLQSGAFYPFNLLFFIFPFSFSWVIYIVLQLVLYATFLYFYLKNLAINKQVILFGVVALCFSSFAIVWLEWGNILHTVLWLPLLLLSVDKILTNTSKKSRKDLVWSIVFLISLLSSFFAGHLQLFFYTFIVTCSYIVYRLIEYKDNRIKSLYFIFLFLLFILLSLIQLLPTLQFINLSARSVDQLNNWTKDGWFVPWQHLIQFVAPDFFGNPTTNNYWGIWNYAELVGYIGIVPLLFALYGMFFRRDRLTLFFIVLLIISLLFALPTPIAKIPFIYNIPFLATSQPTRLLFVAEFSLVMLSIFGFDLFLKNNRSDRKIYIPMLLISSVFVGLWILVLTHFSLFTNFENKFDVAKSNLIFPTAIMLFSILLFIAYRIVNKKYLYIVMYALLLLVSYDLLRFAFKFESFTKKEYLFPTTKTFAFLKKDKDIFRVAANHDWFVAPNILTYYKIQSIEGYDPLYLKSYGEFIAAMERGRPDISPPFGFNRIITPRNISSKFMDLLNVKYVLSFDDLPKERFKKVFQEGLTKVFENKKVIPRMFFVKKVYTESTQEEVIKKLYEKEFDVKTMAVVEENKNEITQNEFTGEATIVIKKYSENEVDVNVSTTTPQFLVFTDAYYPTWKAVSSTGVQLKIHRTNGTFRGVMLPVGNYSVHFYTTLL